MPGARPAESFWRARPPPTWWVGQTAAAILDAAAAEPVADYHGRIPRAARSGPSGNRSASTGTTLWSIIQAICSASCQRRSISNCSRDGLSISHPSCCASVLTWSNKAASPMIRRCSSSSAAHAARALKSRVTARHSRFGRGTATAPALAPGAPGPRRAARRPFAARALLLCRRGGDHPAAN